MTLPADLLARRAIEDRAAKLGASRAALEADLGRNTAEIRVLLRDSEGVAVPLDQLAQLTGVSRQTLHRWRNEVGPAHEMLSDDAALAPMAGIMPGPTLRQAIAMVFLDSDKKRWKPSEVINALELRGWLPVARSADQMTRNRLHSMAAKQELLKDNAGNYCLGPNIRNGWLDAEHVPDSIERPRRDSDPQRTA